MKKENLPQDPSFLKNFTREVNYVKGDSGKYEQGLSSGWEVKNEALNEAWSEIDRRIAEAAMEVELGNKSPILFFMELNLMDFPTLCSYTGYWKFTIKQHFKPKNFSRLSQKRLDVYARVFKITVEELTTFDGKNIDKYTNK